MTDMPATLPNPWELVRYGCLQEKHILALTEGKDRREQEGQFDGYHFTFTKNPGDCVEYTLTLSGTAISIDSLRFFVICLAHNFRISDMPYLAYSYTDHKKNVPVVVVIWGQLVGNLEKMFTEIQLTIPDAKQFDLL